MNTLISAAARRTATPGTARRVPLTARAAAQHAGRVPATLDRITTTAGNVPSASAFQSAL
uniref:FXSXX-COOH protein n=1 Tax=Streptomyces sp. NBC_00003 TaxID=2903608 RepID=A0AAU2V9T5_9ACTN